MSFLSTEFLEKYENAPQHMNELGSFVFYRTYSRFIPELGRRETWKEAVARAVNYNIGIAKNHFDKLGFPVNETLMSKEAEALYDNIFNLRQFLSGRTHWVGGAESSVADKYPLSNFNCAFIEIEKWEDLCELFYLLLVGTGVGFSARKANVAKMNPLRADLEVIHAPYEPVAKEQRLENTKLSILENGYAKMYVGDSKEGWCEALRYYFEVLQGDHNVHTLKISYNSVRPQGEELKTFGGRASGHQTLLDMFEGINKTVKGELDTYLNPPIEIDNLNVMRPVHVMDMANLIGYNVVAGGVRRTAEITLFDSDDYEIMLAKYGINGIWDEDKHINLLNSLAARGLEEWAIKLAMLPIKDANARPLHHRRMSNNSIVFESKPEREFLELVFEIMQSEGEPGFVNLEEAKRRRPNAKGLNPCAEILLDSRGVCNLTTVNVMQFVKDGQLDFAGLMRAQSLSARAGLRMTLLDLELAEWDKVHKRDRLIGTSLTGWQDAMGALKYDKEQELQLLNMLEEVVRMEGEKYAYSLRIPVPLLDTTIKPEGTLSQVAGGVSAGLHVSHAPYYIRRIRINANDPLAKVAQSLGWTVNPEVGTSWLNATTLVIDFPVKSEAARFKKDQDARSQFDTYFEFQEHYTAHNSSNTISVKPDEWEYVVERVFTDWDNFIGVSFLAEDGGSYELAPYEEITEEKYNELKSSMQPFNAKLLERWETTGLSEVDEDCAGGACGVR